MTASAIARSTETFEWVGRSMGPRLETGMSGLAYLTGVRDGSSPRPSSERLMSAELLDVAPGRVQLIASVADSQFGLHRELDPGLAGLLVNTAVHCVARTLLGVSQGWATSASNSDYIRPAAPRTGILIASAEVVERWEARGLVRGELTDECGLVLLSVTSAIDLFDL